MLGLELVCLLLKRRSPTNPLCGLGQVTTSLGVLVSPSVSGEDTRTYRLPFYLPGGKKKTGEKTVGKGN